MSWNRVLSILVAGAVLGLPLHALADNDRHDRDGNKRHDRDDDKRHDRDAHNKHNKKKAAEAALEAQLIAGYAALVGSAANATSLVKGLHNDKLITLSFPGTPGTPGTPAVEGRAEVLAKDAVFCPPPPRMPGCVPADAIPYQPAIPAQDAIPGTDAIPGEEVSFNSPTKALKYKEVKTVLWFMHAKLMEMDKTMTVARPTQVKEALVGNTGILTMRAKHMSWRQIARKQGFTFVDYQDDGKHDRKHHDLDDDDDDDDD